MQGQGSLGTLAMQLVAVYMERDHRGLWRSSWRLYTWEGITGDSGNPACGYVYGGGITGNSGNPASGYMQGEDSGNQAGGYIQREGSLGTLAIQLVAIYRGRDHWGL